jgi:hypothetical protein
LQSANPALAACARIVPDIGDGLACRDRCEERGRAINQMIDANTRVLAVANTQLRRNMVFTFVAGLLFAAFGVYFGFDRSGFPGVIFVVLGGAFIFRGISSYTRFACTFPVISLAHPIRLCR